MEERIIDPDLQPEEIPAEIGLRPRTLAGVCGTDGYEAESVPSLLRRQRGGRKHWTMYCFTAVRDWEKTSLSHIIAGELGVNIRSTSGPVIEKPGDLAAILTNLQPKDVLFIDEIHRLNHVGGRNSVSGHGRL